jgi:ABC-2 type transport system permease protein
MTTVKTLSSPSFASDLRALKAVMRRAWLIFFRYPSWMIALLVWPVIFPMAYIIGARALAGPDGSQMAVFQRAAGTFDFMGYIAIGTTVWMWQNIILWDVGFSLRSDQLRGTLESNWLTPTWRFSFLLGSTAVQLFSMGIFLLVSALEFTVFFGVRLNGNPFLVLLMLLAAIPSIYGLGFAFASVVITAKEANAFVFLVRGLVMIFCGITYPLSITPGWMQSVAHWLPPTYIIHGIRQAALNDASLATLLPDLIPLVLFGIFWLVVGYLMFKFMEHRARQTGAIGQY